MAAPHFTRRRRRDGRRSQPAARGLERRGDPDFHDADRGCGRETYAADASRGSACSAVAHVESRLVDGALDLVAVEDAILQWNEGMRAEAVRRVQFPVGPEDRDQVPATLRAAGTAFGKRRLVADPPPRSRFAVRRPGGAAAHATAAGRSETAGIAVSCQR